MPWYLYIIYKQLFPSDRKLPSFFFLMSVLGVILGVAVMVSVQSVMGGFGEVYREKIITTTGHVQISSSKPIYDYRKRIETLKQNDDVYAATPYAQGFVMLQYRDRSSFPLIRGVDIESVNEVLPLESFMTYGHLKDLDDDSVILSTYLAKQIGAISGSTIEVYSPLMLEGLKQDEVILPFELKVVGIYETGWNQFDSSTMICTLYRIQEIYGLDDSIHGISIRLKDGVNEVAFANQLNKNIDYPLYAQSWQELYKDFLWVLALEKNMMFFLLIFIVIVAAFAISMAQLMTVLRKTREIGLLVALGGTPKLIARAYCLQGLFIGIIGTGLGMLLAISILHFRDPIIGLISDMTGSRETLIQFYQFAHLPVHYSIQDFIIIGVSTIFISTLSGVIPAIRALRMNPAEALRSE